jgi:hypothetical protein
VRFKHNNDIALWLYDWIIIPVILTTKKLTQEASKARRRRKINKMNSIKAKPLLVKGHI